MLPAQEAGSLFLCSGSFLRAAELDGWHVASRYIKGSSRCVNCSHPVISAIPKTGGPPRWMCVPMTITIEEEPW